MADKAAAPVDEADEKEGTAAAPLLELIDSVEATLDGGQAKVPWKVAGKQGDNGEYEYFAIVRVPAIDLASTADKQKPLAVTLKPDVPVIAAQINAVGGAPLAGTKVQAVDAETGLPVGEPAETDDEGKVHLQVEENKPHQIQIVDDDHDDTPPAEAEQHHEEPEAPATPILSVKLLTPTGEPRGGVEVEVKPAAGGDARKVTTGAQGELRLDGVAAGAYTITAGGKTAKAHTITAGDLAADHEPYRAVMK